MLNAGVLVGSCLSTCDEFWLSLKAGPVCTLAGHQCAV